MAAGLTLIFGIMDMVNLAHGTLYMLGGFFATTLAFWTDTSVWGIVLAIPPLHHRKRQRCVDRLVGRFARQRRYSSPLPWRLERFWNVVTVHDALDPTVERIPGGFAKAVAAHHERSAGIEFFVTLLATGKFGANHVPDQPE